MLDALQVNPIVFYRIDRGPHKVVSYRIFFEDRYVIFTPEIGRVSSVAFGYGDVLRDREFALDMFRRDSDWIEM